MVKDITNESAWVTLHIQQQNEIIRLKDEAARYRQALEEIIAVGEDYNKIAHHALKGESL